MSRVSMRENRIKPFSNLLLNSIFLIYAAACILPLVLVFSVSVSNEVDISKYGYSLIPHNISFDSYVFLLKDYGSILRAYAVTIFVSTVGVAGNMVLIALCAYPMSRAAFRYRNICSVLFVIPMLFSGGMVSTYMIYVSVLNIKNSYLAMILPIMMDGFYVLVTKSYFQMNIHPAMIESAHLDGASEYRIFWSIVLPLAKPVLATVSFMTLVAYWNDWINCLLYITDSKKYNIMYLLQKIQHERTFFRDMFKNAGIPPTEFAKAPTETMRMAMAVICILPMILAFPFFQKYLVKGMTLGAIKE